MLARSLSLLLAILVSAAGVQAQPPKVDVGKLAAILGSPVERWQFSRRQGGAKEDFRLIDIGKEPALAANVNAPILTRLDPITSDSEVTIRFRFALQPKGDIWYWLTAGIKKVEENGENIYKLALAVPAGMDTETVNWSLPVLPGETSGSYGTYTIRQLPKSRLTWPELARLRVEQDFAAATPLGQRWITVRYVLRKNAFQIWLDDRLLRDARGPKIDSFGMIRLTLFEGVQLGSVRVRPLPPEDSRFEVIRLDGDVNAGKIKGAALQRDSLPGGGKDLKVQGVPFTLPAMDARGNDHIDLGPSWLQAGMLEGDFDSYSAEAGRWRGAMHRDPGRIAFRVPQARYRALHLLATFADEPDTTPVVTAQFYRPAAGHPVNFAARVPAFAAKSTAAVPVRLAGGGQGNLYLVTIPLEPEGLDAFADKDHLEFELTKQVRIYRSYPDPIEYSQHGGGLPSGVHVYGITLERPGVDVDLQPDRHAHTWTAPEQPSYTVKLRNLTSTKQDVTLDFLTASYDDLDKTSQTRKIGLAPLGEQAVKLPLKLARHGHHRAELRVKDAVGLRTRTRSLAYLHPDTRERGNWEEGKGQIFGFWDWNGGHGTMSGVPRLEFMVAAGAESKMSPFYHKIDKDLYPDDDTKFARKHKMMTFFHAYQLSMRKDILGVEWDPKKPAEMEKALIAGLKKQPQLQRSDINRPELAIFFAEPVLGPVSYMSLPEYYGEPPYQMTADEKKNYENMLAQFVIGARAIKKEWPGTKCLMPWGLPMFPVPFLRQSKEATELMDGPALDVVLFERLPEMQLHQVTISSQMWQLKQEWAKTGKPWPNFTAIEGPAVSPSRPGALTRQQESDHSIRAFLILAAYGNNRHLGWPTPSTCAGYWGETHYGGGMCEPLPLLSPNPIYPAYAALTRQLNRMNFVKQIHTGSNTTLCLQFKHYKSGELLHVLWTVKGKRPAQLDASAGAKITVFDWMDNATTPAVKDGKVEVVATTSPCYIRGLKADAKFTLGEPDHRDAAPALTRALLAKPGDGTWKLSTEQDAHYENCHPEFIRRFPGRMTIEPKKVAEQHGGVALAVHLDKQPKERRTMPFYSTLIPPKPLVIPGKASHLSLWVKASSDWGRVVYCLRDAKGERWISVGKKGEWNVDDVHCWSQFCFDGWRYLRFEMPGNLAYDGYREAGTSFWGPYGPGDGIVDFPLTLEKIIVERRTHVIAGTEQVPASSDDVLLGDLFAEYEQPADKSDEAVRQAKLRMPVSKDAPALDNPIRKLADTGVGAATTITKVVPPEREPDGSRCHVSFTPVAGAKSYDVWVSPYADGRGAIRLGADWKESGQLLTGLRAGMDFYLFVAYVDAAGRPSRPSPAFKIHLKDMFPMR